MKSRLISLGLLIGFLGSPAAQAQMTMDVAKITCRQFLIGKVASPKSVANWLSGYYNGKRGNTVIEIGEMERHVHKLEAYCRKHHDMAVMEAAKAALNIEK
jgi:acid stress chaperone HdeB